MKCSDPGCDRLAKWRGMCSAHYQRWVKATKPEDREGAPGLPNGGRFAPKPDQKHAALVAPFGGVKPFCRAVGIDPNTLYRWPGEGAPTHWHPLILDAAVRSRADISAVRAALGISWPKWDRA